MLRTVVFLAFLSPAYAMAQTATEAPPAEMNHQTMNHSKMHGQVMGEIPKESGQSAFAAIQEIVGILEADPATDWTKVNIDALRAHLADMDAVTLHAKVRSEAVENGIKFTVTGDEPVRASIRRMITAHAATINGIQGWQFRAEQADAGATMIKHSGPDEAPVKKPTANKKRR